ncbi:hypothetical protein [Thioclava sp. GXIMD4215]|uniref:hypothetical protein n=1 Tax=Thioclava sp. GXIMD4215 TaxID=3131928 RepID=UPI0032443F14
MTERTYTIDEQTVQELRAALEYMRIFGVLLEHLVEVHLSNTPFEDDPTFQDLLQMCDDAFDRLSFIVQYPVTCTTIQ